MTARIRWTDTTRVLAILEHAGKRGAKTLGYIRVDDAPGGACCVEFEKFASLRGIEIATKERFASRCVARSKARATESSPTASATCRGTTTSGPAGGRGWS